MRLLFIVFLILVYSGIALFVSINNYLYDGQDRRLISIQYTTLHGIASENLINKRTEEQISIVHNTIQEMTSGCVSVNNQITVDVINLAAVDPSILLWKSINETIVNYNTSCTNQINMLTTTLNQLINGTNATSKLSDIGTCQFTPKGINVTTLTTVGFEYRLYQLNGIDFYYYKFGSSSDIIDGSKGAYINNCSPILFANPVTSNKMLIHGGQTNGIVGSPVAIDTYLSHVRIGLEHIELVPVSDPTVNQTLFLSGGFELWVNLF